MLGMRPHETVHGMYRFLTLLRYIIARNPEYDFDYEPIDNERGERVTYYDVSNNQPGGGQQGQMNYGGTARPQPKGQQQSGIISNAPAASESGAVAGASSSSEQHVPSGENAPPTYADAVKGDHKVQTRD
jgi:hypothetical protein